MVRSPPRWSWHVASSALTARGPPAVGSSKAGISSLRSRGSSPGSTPHRRRAGTSWTLIHSQRKRSWSVSGPTKRDAGARRQSSRRHGTTGAGQGSNRQRQQASLRQTSMRRRQLNGGTWTSMQWTPSSGRRLGAMPSMRRRGEIPALTLRRHPDTEAQAWALAMQWHGERLG